MLHTFPFFSHRPLPCSCGPEAHLLILTGCFAIGRLLQLFLCSLEMLPDPSLSPEAVIPRQGLYLGAVVHDALQRDEAFGAHDTEHVHKKLVEGVLVGGAKISERMIVDWFHAGEPLVGGIVVAQARDLSRVWSLDILSMSNTIYLNIRTCNLIRWYHQFDWRMPSWRKKRFETLSLKAWLPRWRHRYGR